MEQSLQYRKLTKHILDVITDAVASAVGNPAQQDELLMYYCRKLNVDADKAYKMIMPRFQITPINGKLSVGQIRQLQGYGWSIAKIQRVYGIAEGRLRRALKSNDDVLLNVRPNCQVVNRIHPDLICLKIISLLRESAWYIRQLDRGIRPGDAEILAHYFEIEYLKKQQIKKLEEEEKKSGRRRLAELLDEN